MTEREFDERLRREYRAAASSWTPERKTKAALLEKLEANAAPRRSAARTLRPAVALCCCALIAAAALLVLREQPQAEDVAVTAMTAMTAQGESSEAAAAAAPSQGDAVSGEAEAANDADSMEKAQARGAQNGAQAFAEAADASGGVWLTQEEIDALRGQYPIVNPSAPTAMMVLPSLSEVMELVDTFVYGEVVGQETVEESLSTGDEALDAKWQGAGAGEVSFSVVTLRVIEDTAGLFAEGDEIALWENADLAVGPRLTEGMRVVLPAVENDRQNRYDADCIGSYYVTPEGFVLSVFDEEQCGGSWNGAPVEELLAGLKG